MARVMTTAALALALLAAMPAFGAEPARLSESDLDRATAGRLPGHADPSFDVLFAIAQRSLPALGEPDDDIWDLLGSGVQGSSGVLQAVRGFLHGLRVQGAD